MKKIKADNSKYNKNNFLMLSDCIKNLLSKESSTNPNVQYCALHIKLIFENNSTSIEHDFIRKFIPFLRAYLNKDSIITYLKKNEFIVFIDNVKSSTRLLEIIKSLEKSSSNYFNNIGIESFFYINLTYSRIPLFYTELETFYRNISNGFFNIYDMKVIYIKKKVSPSSIILSDIKINHPQTRKDLIDDLLNNYIYKDDLFHSILNVVSTSKGIDDSVEGIFNLFKQHLKIDFMYLYLISDDNKYFINRSNFLLNDDKLPKISSIPTSHILKFLDIHNENGIWYNNDFRKFPFILKKYFKQTKIKSICNSIIVDENQLLGFLGFESKDSEKIWSPYEISKLTFLSKILSVFIKFNNISLISDKENNKAINIIDSIDSFIYAIDKDYNLTFTNENFKRKTQYRSVRKKCYEVLMNGEYPCTFCPIKNIDSSANNKNSINRCINTELYYSAIDTYYKVYITENLADLEHKYVFTGFDINFYKKVHNSSYSDKKFYLFDDIQFTLPEFYNAITSTTDNHIIFFDMNYDKIYIPDRLLYELGYNTTGRSYSPEFLKSFIYDRDVDIFFNTYNNLKYGRVAFCDISFRIYGKNKNSVWIKFKASISYDFEYKSNIIVGIATLLNKKPVIDYITNLPNKYHLKYVLEENFRNKNEPLALLLVKVDNLSKISKIFGRNVADLAFINIVDIIKNNKKSNMMLFSFEWNTIAIKIDTINIYECIDFYNELTNIFIDYNIISQTNYYATLSGGCVLYPKDASSYHALISSAEYALEHSDQEGKHNIVFFNQRILDIRNRKNRISQIIGESISNGFKGFNIVYQSHIDTQTTELLGAEALARFKCEEFGNVPPDEFIPILEEMGFIQPMGKWILVNAVKDCYNIQKYMPNFHINVNVSYLQLLEDDFIDFLKETLRTYPLTKGTLYLELTETSIVKNKDDLIRKFKKIQELGVKIAMDDFGIGYSSLGILKDIPLDMLKIDKIFVKGINSNKFDASFIQVISTLCLKANIESCLEGVEEESELNSIRIYSDVSMIQGYYYGRPEPFNKFVRRFNIFEPILEEI